MMYKTICFKSNCKPNIPVPILALLPHIIDADTPLVGSISPRAVALFLDQELKSFIIIFYFFGDFIKPITPHANLFPALPVFKDSASPPRPKSSRSW